MKALETAPVRWGSAAITAFAMLTGHAPLAIVAGFTAGTTWWAHRTRP